MPRGYPKAKATPSTISEAEVATMRARIAELEAEKIEAPHIRAIDKPKLSGTVTVACKIPQGMVLQLQHPMMRRVPTGRGQENDYQNVEFMIYGGPRYHVFGPAVPAMGGVPGGYILPKAIEGGYALTDGIPASFWATWKEQHAKADYVTSGMIFAYDDASAKSAAREQGERLSGLEPLHLNEKGELSDRRTPKSLNGAVARITSDADRQAERKQFAPAE
jgi:hypothetical protein